jgi:hypothetical protein
VIFLKKHILQFILIIITLTLFSESVIMVFPQEDDAIILFDDHSWYYHSEISWYDSVDFVHFDEDCQFSILEERSYLSEDGKIVIKGIAMNTSGEPKSCEVSYAILDSEKNIISTGKSRAQEEIEPGNLFPYTIEIANAENAKYISFDYIMEVK